MTTWRLRVGSVALAAGLGVAGLSACGVERTYSVQDDATVNQAVSAIRLDGDSGGVTVDGRAGTSTVSIHRRVDSPNNGPAGPTFRVEGGTLVLSGCGQHCSVDYTVTVPPDLPVTGRTTSGEITLTSVGAVDVSTSSGGVTLTGVRGPTKVETTNGAVHGTGIRGANVAVRTSNGGIDLTLANPQDVRAETSNGAIDLGVPGGPYAITTNTHNGDQDVSVPNDPAGRYRLDLTTSNGAITVRPA